MGDGRKDRNKGRAGIDRRDFLKYAGAAGTAFALSDFAIPEARAAEAKKAGPKGKVHVLACNEKTSTDGYWDNSTPPVLTIKSGDTVYVETGTHLMSRMKPGADINDWMTWFKEVIDKTPETYFFPDEVTGAQKIRKGAGHHHLTGPIYVEDAEPGDFLQVELLDIDPGPYGFNLNPETSFVNLGLLKEDYPKGKVRWYTVNRKDWTFEFQPGIKIPVRPFPGTIGVELPEKGMWSNVPPGRHGGNLDNKDLIKGTVLYLPVWVKGAGFKTGDSHFAQGHGEINLNALEGFFKNFTLRFTVRKDLGKLIDWPVGSSPTHWIMMGMHTDAYKSCQMAARQAVSFLNRHYGMEPMEAYAFCSQAVDFHVTQLVDYTIGIHAMIPKGCFVGKQYAGKNGLLIPKQA
ncbi:MAG: acetamidase/formamidase family protein [Thermodesulfobacteriota bacterium]